MGLDGGFFLGGFRRLALMCLPAAVQCVHPGHEPGDTDRDRRQTEGNLGAAYD